MRLTFILSLVFFISAGAQTPMTQRSTEQIIDTLRKNPAEIGFINELAKRAGDPRVVPALRDLFVQAKLSNVKEPIMGYPMARFIACALISLGIRDDVYFEEVARYAREAITADPPIPFLEDADGKADASRRNPAFEEWCATRSLEFNACTKKWGEYVMDIQFLSGIRDSRAVPIFRSGLTAANDYIIVQSAAAGLAVLNDKGSIPLIAAACARFLPDQAESIVIIGSTQFDDPSVQVLFNSFIKDPRTLESVKKAWQEKRAKSTAQSSTPEKP